MHRCVSGFYNQHYFLLYVHDHIHAHILGHSWSGNTIKAHSDAVLAEALDANHVSRVLYPWWYTHSSMYANARSSWRYTRTGGHTHLWAHYLLSLHICVYIHVYVCARVLALSNMYISGQK